MEIYDTNYLSHHGTKGMKWGIRRYQNSDGSLTDAGRKRYGSEDSKPRMSLKEKTVARKKTKEAEAKKQARLEAMRKGKEAKQKQAEEEAKKQAETAKKREEVLKSRSAKTLYENAHLFTNDELYSAYQRLQLERNIANLAPKEVSKGEKFVDNMVNAGRKINDVTEVGTRLYNNMARLHNSLSDSNDKWPIIKDNDKKQDNKKKDKNNDKKNKDKDQNTKNDHDNSGKNGKSNDKESGNTKSSKSKKQKKTDYTKETFTGTVEGEGKSKGSQSKKDTKKNKPSNYYDPIDSTGEWVNESVLNLPAVYTNSGQSWIAGYLEDYGR